MTTQDAPTYAWPSQHSPTDRTGEAPALPVACYSLRINSPRKIVSSENATAVASTIASTS